jgi:hypothetical protein
MLYRPSTPPVGAKSVPHATLTDLAARAVEAPAKGTVTLWDGSLKHFGLRVSQGGTKSFILLLGSGRRQTIGHYPTISIAQARTKAKTILAERTLGLHTPQVISWDRALELFLEVKERETRPLTASLYRSTLERAFGFGTKKLCDISKSDISQKLQKYKDRFSAVPRLYLSKGFPEVERW